MGVGSLIIFDICYPDPSFLDEFICYPVFEVINDWLISLLVVDVIKPIEQRGSGSSRISLGISILILHLYADSLPNTRRFP